MPVYEYHCKVCGRTVSVLVRKVEAEQPACPRCGATGLTRLISGFAFHKSLRSKVEQLDPKYEKMVDSANPDLSFDSLAKKYKLDQPLPERETD